MCKFDSKKQKESIRSTLNADYVRCAFLPRCIQFYDLQPQQARPDGSEPLAVQEKEKKMLFPLRTFPFSLIVAGMVASWEMETALPTLPLGSEEFSVANLRAPRFEIQSEALEKVTDDGLPIQIKSPPQKNCS